MAAVLATLPAVEPWHEVADVLNNGGTLTVSTVTVLWWHLAPIASAPEDLVAVLKFAAANGYGVHIEQSPYSPMTAQQFLAKTAS